MPNNYDQDIQQMSRYARRERAAIEHEQIRHISLDEYRPGCERFERLWHGIEQAHKNYSVYWADVNV